MSEHEVKKALSKTGGKKAKTHVHAMHIRRAANGGLIAKHELADEQGNPVAGGGEHVLTDPAAAADHLQQTMGDQPAAGAGGGDNPQEEAAEQQPPA